MVHSPFRFGVVAFDGLSIADKQEMQPFLSPMVRFPSPNAKRAAAPDRQGRCAFFAGAAVIQAAGL